MTARQGINVAPRIPDTQGVCCLTTAPNLSERWLGRAIALPSTNMNGTGVLNVPGVYECEILCDGWSGLDVTVRCSAIAGAAVTPFLRTRWADGSTRLEAAGVAFVANTPQTLTLNTLRGQRKAWLVFTLAPGDSLTFDRAEFNGL
jgi:hypothetical protein